MDTPEPRMAKPMAKPSYVGVNDLTAEVLSLAFDPTYVPFGAACPDHSLFPTKKLARILAAVGRNDPTLLGRYAMNWAYWYYKQWFPRKGFSKKPPGISRSKMAMVMDCPAYNIGWNAASFSWGTDINPWVYTPWDPYYPFRHPGKTANVAYMDGHVERVGSFAQGRGDPVYWPVYDTDPDGTPPSSGVAYAVYPY